MKSCPLFKTKHIVLTALFTFPLLIMISPIPRLMAALPPAVTIDNPVDGQALNNPVVDISGTSDPSVAVDVYIDDTRTGSVTADSTGKWAYTTGSLAEGTHRVYANATDSMGNTGVSNTVNFEIDVTPPVVTITNPTEGSYTNSTKIEGQTEAGLAVTVYVYGQEATVTADGTGYWVYWNDTLPEGAHSVYASAVDKAGNNGVSETRSFILDMTRPVISPDIFPADSMTQVPLDVVTRVYLIDKSPIDSIRLPSAIIMRSGGTSVDSQVYGTVYSSVYSTVYGTNYYEIIFKPDQQLSPGIRYSVTVNPELTDAAGNPVHPRKWYFTAMGNGLSENPHGNYISNVNTCGNCHSPHRGDQPKTTRPPDFPETRYAAINQIDVYCNACHDGTAAPVPAGWSASSRHDFQMSIDGTKGTSSCAGCHNPHLTWIPDNPNFLQDYYYYEHTDPTDPYIPNSSEEQLCEACHKSTIKDDSRVTYVRYSYEKWHTAAGAAGDYSLCLRCHDGKNAVNIAVYYNGPSRHFLSALDASPLNGHIPCAECHETHGSNNIKMLKEELGHNYTVEKFTYSVSVWDQGAERLFCTRCHNNITELYGITVGIDQSIPGHEAGNSEYCHKCHGGSPAAAAHGPR